MTKILVPVDGSEASEKAIQVGLETAGEDGSVTLVRVLETTQLSGWLPIDMVAAHQQEKRLVEKYLEDVAAKYPGVETMMHEGPDPADGIAAAAKELNVDLVILNSQGRSGLGEAILGSTAERLMRRLDRPALVLKGDLGTPGHSKILVPLDGSKLAEEALRYAGDFVDPGAQLLLVGVSTVFLYLTPLEKDHELVVEPDLKRIRDYLEKRAETLNNLGFQAEAFAEHGDAAREICRLAEVHEVDAVVLSSHGRSGLDRMFFGSVTEGVLRSCSRPVLVVR